MRHSTVRPLFVGLLLLVTLVALPGSATPSEISDQIGELLVEAFPAGEPGAALRVERGDELLYRGASGMADLELGVELAPDMVFRLGSITKQFTSAMILLLAEEGRLALDDPLEKFLPSYPTHGHTITVKHLLNHTSGIRSYTSIPGYMDQEIRRDLTTEELVAVFSGEPMEFAPGTAWSYNNSGYVLLGALLEEVSGKSYSELLETRLFDPLRLEHTRVGGEQIVPRRARGYDKEDGVWVNAPYLSMTQPHGAGALISTVDDVARWTHALHGGEVVSAESLAAMTSPTRLADGEEVPYGYGLSLSTVRGRPVIQHGGGIHGFRTFALWMPEEEVLVVILSNAGGGGATPGEVALQVAALAAGDPFPTFERIELPEETLAGYVGTYRISEEATRTVVLEDGRLYTQRSGGDRLEAIPAGETTFFYDDSLTWFEMVREDGEWVMEMHHDGADEAERAVRVSTEVAVRREVEVSPEVLAAYVGRYELAPGFVLTVTLEGGQLMTQATGQEKVAVFAESESRFFLKAVDAQIEFRRDESRVVTGLVLYQGELEIPGPRLAD